MAITFSQARDVELSLLYFLETSFDASWSSITLVKSFKNVYAKDINIPIVCVSLIDITTTRLEIGATTLEDRYIIAISLFCSSEAMRIDLSAYVKSELKNGWVHYDHSHQSGDKSTLVRSANGRDFVTSFLSDSKIEFGENISKKDRYRQEISIEVRKSS